VPRRASGDQPFWIKLKSSTFTQLPAFASEYTPTWIDPFVTAMPETVTFVQLPSDWLIDADSSLPPKFFAKIVAFFCPPLLFTHADSVYVPFGREMFWYREAV
jgi:hypothetical protein